MPTLAKTIKIIYHKDLDLYSFSIDGKEFPWFIAEEGFSLDLNKHELPSVSFTLLADKVEVINDWS